MKINWGTGIAITLALFAFGMGYAVYKAMNTRHDLVTTDYYQQELAYQQTIDSKRNARALEGDCRLIIQDEALYLDFPESLSGKTGKLSVTMYFPTSAARDFVIEQENWEMQALEIPGDKIAAGKWIAKVQVEVDETPYYFEPSIVL